MGNENALGFSLKFNANDLQFVGAKLVNAPGAMLIVNTNKAANGEVGLALALSPGKSFSKGLQDVIQLTFRSLSHSSINSLTMANSPVQCEVANANADTLPADYAAGSIIVTDRK